MRKLVPLILIIIIVAVVGGVAYWLTSRKSANSQPSDWQAIFLDSGDVYFGKISNKDEQFITLKNVYYLKVNQQKEGESSQQPPLSLVKLGNELHGPVDAMEINRDHVLFIEQMRNNAKVVEAISRYEANGDASASPAPLVSPSPAS